MAAQIDGRLSPADGRTARQHVYARDARPPGVRGSGRHAGHVFDRHFDRELQRLLRARVDDGHRAVADLALMRGELVGDTGLGVGRFPALRRRAFHASQEPCHLVERPLSGGQPDPLRRPFTERRQPFDRQRQVGAALGRHQGMDLVDDDRVDGAERLARVRREEQIERFGRCDEDVGRLALKSGPFALRRVAGPDGNGRGDVRLAAGGRPSGQCR